MQTNDMSSYEIEGSIFMDKKMFGSWVTKLVAHTLATAALWFESRISQKNTKWAT
jgi:hypothetical protein